MSSPPEADWERRSEAQVPPRVLQRIAGEAALEPLEGGLVNRNLRCGDRVLRVWTRGVEGARTELAALRRVADLVPVPRVLDSGVQDGWPWAWLQAMPGRRLSEAMADGLDARPHARQLGEHAAALHRVTLDVVGFLDDELRVSRPLGPDWWRAYVTECLEDPAGARLGPRRVAALEALEAPEAAPPVLLHADFKPTNVLVLGDEVTAILDWEFAWSGPALFDLGQLLRWEDHATAGFAEAVAEGYGGLPAGWRRQAALLDLANLVGFLADPEERPRVYADVLGRVDRLLGANG